MLAKILSGATVGLSSIPVTVEVDISSGTLPSFKIVGLPSKSIEESKERVRAAIRNSGVEFPRRKITVNLAPASLPKEGPAYDLAIAVGILIASGQIENKVRKALFYGELSLDGSIKHVNGVLPMAMLVKEKKYKAFFLPKINAREASIIKGIKVYPVTSLIHLLHHLSGLNSIRSTPHTPFQKLNEQTLSEFDFADIKGQEQAKRALEISAAGGHNLQML